MTLSSTALEGAEITRDWTGVVESCGVILAVVVCCIGCYRRRRVSKESERSEISEVL
jgi:hypothetical protein